jgi:SMODS and SLOG-associating 2TM effector domain 1
MFAELFAPVIASLITLAVMQAAVFIADAIRNRDYRLFEDQSKEYLTGEFPIPTPNPSKSEELRRSLGVPLEGAHKTAIKAQETYHNLVVRSAGCLVLGFLATAAGTLHPQELPFLVRFDPSSWELVLGWLEAIPLAAVLVLFLYGRRASQPWIAARITAEFLRQYQFLAIVFPSILLQFEAADAPSIVDETDRLRAMVEGGDFRKVADRIERYWAARMSFIQNSALTAEDVTLDAVLVYLQRRVRRQLGWFSDSKARLEYIARRYQTTLLVLYCVNASLAIIKHFLFLREGHQLPYLQALLTIVTGLSAAMTAYYFNQNARSLIHRYNSQIREITQWLRGLFASRNLVAGAAEAVTAIEKNQIRTDILRFEQSMTEELVDWIHITTHDVIDLSP